MTKSKQNKFLMNLLKFTAPALAVFFGQLALGVKFEVALPLALVAMYGALADFFSKIK
jgi:hypothetical protein